MKWSRPKNRTVALTLVEALVVMAVLCLLGALLLPALRPARVRVKGINCVSNLKQVGLSFRLWADDNTGKYPMLVSVTNGGSMEFVVSGELFRHFQVMSNELSTPKVLVCPSDTRLAGRNFTSGFSSTNISYFVGVDAEETRPQMFLIGDRNLNSTKKSVNGILSLTTNDIVNWTRSMHNSIGNVGLADGHVLHTNTPGLRKLIANSGVATNRLALP